MQWMRDELNKTIGVERDEIKWTGVGVKRDEVGCARGGEMTGNKMVQQGRDGRG